MNAVFAASPKHVSGRPTLPSLNRAIGRRLNRATAWLLPFLRFDLVASRFPSLRRVLFELLLVVMRPRNLLTYLRYGTVNGKIAVDAGSVCQLHCPSCPSAGTVAKGGLVGWGWLKFEQFKRCLDSNRAAIRSVELSCKGEVFLNPHLDEILQYAHAHEVRTTMSAGVNFNHVKAQVLEDLVRYQVRRITVSIDGASNETYQKYRVGGDLERVIANIRKLNEFKKAYKSEYPRLRWQFIAFDHNIHEVRAAQEMATSLGMDFYVKPNSTTKATTSYSPVDEGSADLVKKETGTDLHERTRPWCFQLWLQPQFTWDGQLLGCCINTWSNAGNAFREGLSTVLKGERYEYMKDMLFGLKPPREDIPCTHCTIYKDKIFERYVNRVYQSRDPLKMIREYSRAQSNEV
jgi:hypothetical protein